MLSRFIWKAWYWAKDEYRDFQEAQVCDEGPQVASIVRRVKAEMGTDADALGFYAIYVAIPRTKAEWEKVKVQEDMSNRVLWRSHERPFQWRCNRLH